MTTRVRIEVTQAHLPVRVQRLDKDGNKVGEGMVLSEVGDAYELCVYEQQQLLVTEAGEG